MCVALRGGEEVIILWATKKSGAGAEIHIVSTGNMHQ